MNQPIIALDSLFEPVDPTTLAGGISGGCASSSCGSSAGKAEMDPATWAKVKDHPCYAEEAHHYFARMHVAVAPACNIQCNYCNRKYDCANESRPGVVSERVTPEEALRKVVTVANNVPQLSVLGIAGPGDACHDWHRTKATFELIRAEIPDLKLCLSTNGLALPDRVDDIAALDIDHVTITINMVDPEIGAKIYPWIFYNHKRWTGVEASKILHERQMRGLEMLTERGILAKINSVMIPGINDDHLVEVNREVMKRGAFLHNVMPLISAPEHGTHFGLTGQRGPTPAELKALQDRLGGDAKLMRHCRQCRADAVGLLGEDRGQAFTLDRLPDAPVYDPAPRETYREVVARERGDHVAAKAEAALTVAEVDAARPMLFAVASQGGGRVNQHFGHAEEFMIYEADAAGIRFVGHRKVSFYCLGGFGSERSLETTIRALEGIDMVLCAKIGDCPRETLEAAGLEVTDAVAEEYIEAAIARVYAERHSRRRIVAA